MKTDPKRALVVFSGGQDSTTCLGWALANYDDVACVSFDYGQKHVRELRAAREVVAYFRGATDREIPHEIIGFPGGTLAGTSPLTNPVHELETYTDHNEMEKIIGDRVEKTFVPMRNAFFLMVAANRAVVGGYGHLVTGVCQADNANYPDCRKSFVLGMDVAINLALGTEHAMVVEIQTPLMDLSKADSVRLALSLPHTYAALAFSHTAYDGHYPPTGKDHASILRAHGFEQADRPDPLVLRAVWEGLMDPPDTPNYRPELLNGFTHSLFEAWGKPAGITVHPHPGAAAAPAPL